MMNGYDDSTMMGVGYWLGWLVGLVLLVMIIALVVRIIVHNHKLKKSGKKRNPEADNSEW